MSKREYTYDDAYDDEERIKREVVIVDDEDREEQRWHEEATEREDIYDTEYEEPFADIHAKEHVEQEIENPWMLITTGRILTDGTLPYYRYFIAIAIMCFFSIFLTFVSLNATREYRQREKYASVLHERSVLKEEERYGLSSKSAVTSRLESHGIKLVDLSKESRLIEK